MVSTTAIVISARDVTDRKRAVKALAKSEAALREKTRDLEKKAEQLQKEIEKSGLGADLKPIPEPVLL